MKVIDLSVSLYTNMEVFPGDPEVKINVIHTHEKNSCELKINTKRKNIYVFWTTLKDQKRRWIPCESYCNS